MATEHILSDKLKVIVYYGGTQRGRCYDFVSEEAGVKYTRTLTEEALVRVIRAEGTRPR